MSNYGILLLSKVIDNNDVSALDRHNVSESHFTTDAERKAYRFIKDYAATNRGQAPSYASVTEEAPGFFYTPQVGESYEYLTRRLFNDSADAQFSEFVNNGELARLFNESRDDMPTFFDTLTERVEQIKIRTDVRESIGRTLTDIKTDYLSEYKRREEGKSFKRWDTPFPPLTKEISGWFTGDVYGIIGESGRGKTYLVIKIIDSLLRQGANVLVKSFEVKEYVWISRLISVITAVDEAFVDELGRKLGIPNKRILAGKLDDEIRDKFIEVVEMLDGYYPGNLFFQGKSGPELTRSLDDLEKELTRSKIDAVVIDPFYGLNDVYGKNVNKTSGGAAEYAATRFEQIIGDHDVIGFYTVQASVEKKQKDDEGVREIKLPSRDQVKTSMRLLDIATNLIGFDSVEKEGIAMLGIEKGRNGGEDFTLELTALFDFGVLKELPTGSDVAADFGF